MSNNYSRSRRHPAAGGSSRRTPLPGPPSGGRRQYPAGPLDPLSESEGLTSGGEFVEIDASDADDLTEYENFGYHEDFEEHERDGFQDIQTLIADSDNPDNPPRRQNRARTTIGVEFEFLLAVARRFPPFPDPHPNDDRWISQGRLVEVDEEDPRFYVTMRNLVIDALRGHDVVAVKTLGESQIRLTPTLEFGWLDSLEVLPSNTNRDALERWVGMYDWHPNMGLINVNDIVNQLEHQFVLFHIDQGLQLYETTQQTVSALSMRVGDFVRHPITANERSTIGAIFESRVLKLIGEEKKAYERRVASETDPRGVMLPGIPDKYRAWGCTIDVSVEADPAIGHYHIPPGSIPPFPRDADGELAVPKTLEPPYFYKWFPGEIRTSILDYNDPDTIPAIQRACTALRNNFRIHKPTRFVETGIHIHFGQEAGWTLLHLKKFVTLWMLMEEHLEHLHRRDRSDGSNIFVGKVREMSFVARAVLLNENRDRRLSNLRVREPLKSSLYTRILGQHLPANDWYRVPTQMQNIIEEVWQYDTISELTSNINGHGFASVRLAITGGNLSDSTEISSRTQTIEVRLMQGTLDAEHIRRWMTICHQMIIFCRDTNFEEFSRGLGQMLSKSTNTTEVLGVDPADLAWFAQRTLNNYFAYPDKDIVSWGNPFMVRGFGDTHGWIP